MRLHLAFLVVFLGLMLFTAFMTDSTVKYYGILRIFSLDKSYCLLVVAF